MRFTTPNAPGFAVFREFVVLADAARDTEVGRAVIADGVGGYEPETLAMAAAIISHEDIGLFADIGANIGIYSLVLKSIFGDRLSIDAYEPLPMLNEIARHNAAANHLDINFEASALSDRSGSAIFYVSARSDSSNSLNPTFRKAKATIQVALTTLDEKYPPGSPAPGLLKIDTESTEPDVLRGGLDFIRLQRPWIICEVLHGRNEEQLQKFFSAIGYHAIHLNGDTLDPDRAVKGDPSYQHRDWLFAPTLPTSRLRDLYRSWLDAFSLSKPA